MWGCGQEESKLVRLLHEVMVAFDKEVALHPKLYKVCARGLALLRSVQHHNDVLEGGT